MESKQLAAPSYFKTSDFLGYSLFVDKLVAIDFNRPQVINTINPHSFCVAQKDVIFKAALTSSDILLPDGIGIVMAKRFLSSEKISRIAGMDLFLESLRAAQSSQDPARKKVFLLGSTEKTLQLMKLRIDREFPSLIVDYYSPPFKPSFSADDNNVILEKIERFSPHFLFVGMTAPKQEKWTYINKDKIHANIISSVGAVFDFYAGTLKRPGPLWVDLGLEWLGRFLREPKRLWRRVLISSPLFISKIVKSKLHSL
jgi:N-acetylglucosaminyldiphosphoundecaprenol N-acetyl-beta-D-mannosaminyltransferase